MTIITITIIKNSELQIRLRNHEEGAHLLAHTYTGRSVRETRMGTVAYWTILDQ